MYRIIIAVMVAVSSIFSCGKNPFGPEKEKEESHPYIVNDTTLVDTRNGNEYRIANINGMTWMLEDLNIGEYIDSSVVKKMTDNGKIEKHPKPGINDGATYTFSEAMSYNLESNQGICPYGWHIPSDNEWKDMERYYDMNESQINNFSNGYEILPMRSWHYTEFVCVYKSHINFNFDMKSNTNNNFMSNEYWTSTSDAKVISRRFVVNTSMGNPFELEYGNVMIYVLAGRIEEHIDVYESKCVRCVRDRRRE